MHETSDSEEENNYNFTTNVYHQVMAEFSRDFEEASQVLLSELQTTDEPSIYLDTFVAIHMQQVLHHSTPASQVGEPQQLPDQESHVFSTITLERYECEFLPKVVLRFMTQPQLLLHVQALQEFVQFLQHDLQIIASRLLQGWDSQHGIESLLESLSVILDDAQPFYTLYAHVIELHNRPIDQKHESAFFENLEYWSELGGFQLILYSLSGSFPSADTEQTEICDGVQGRLPVPVQALPYIFRTLYTVQEHVTDAFASQYFNPLVEATTTYVNSLSAMDFNRLSRECVMELLQILEIWLCRVMEISSLEPNQTKDYKREKEETPEDFQAENDLEVLNFPAYSEEALLAFTILRLELYRRFILSVSLERQLSGLTDLSSFLVTATKASSKLKKRIVSWMESCDLLSSLFSVSIHDEVLKRCIPMIKFLIDMEALSRLMLEEIWIKYRDSWTGGIVQSISSSPQTRKEESAPLYELILDICSQGSAQVECDMLYLIQSSTIADTLYPKVEVQIAEICSAIAHRAKEINQQDLVYEIITFLWCNRRSSQFMEKICEILDGQLQKFTSNSEIERCLKWTLSSIFKTCWDQIKIPQSQKNSPIELTEALKALTALLTCISATRDSSSQLLYRFYKSEIFPWSDLSTKAFGVSLVQQLTRILEKSSCEELDQAIFLALNATWRTDVRLSHQFDTWQACVSKTELSAIWSAVTKDQFSTRSNLYFEWINECCKSSEYDHTELLTADLARYFLSFAFCNLHGRSISCSVAQCFQRVFNLANRNLLRTNELLRSLHGIDTLWRLTIEAEHLQVVSELSSFLTSVYAASAEQYQFNFIDSCFTRLTRAKVDADTLQDGQDGKIKVVMRCVELLCFCLDAYAVENRKHTPLPKKASKVSNSDAKVSECRLRQLEISPLDESHQPERHSWKNFASKFTGDSTLLEEESGNYTLERDVDGTSRMKRYRFDSAIQSPSEGGPDISSLNVEGILTSVEKDICRENRWKEIASNEAKYFSPMSQKLAHHPTYFPILFDLMDWNISLDVGQRVWELFSRLPLNQSALQEMITLKPAKNALGMDWRSLLDITHLHRLLYTLCVMEGLWLTSDITTEFYQTLRWNWINKFTVLGGLEHLYRTIANWELQPHPSVYRRNLGFSCLRALTRMLLYFINVSDQTNVTRTAHSGPSDPENASHSLSDDFESRFIQATLKKYLREKLNLQALLMLTTDRICQLCANTDCVTTDQHELITSSLQLFAIVLEKEVAFDRANSTSLCVDLLQADGSMHLSSLLNALFIKCPCLDTRTSSLMILGRLTRSACKNAKGLKLVHHFLMQALQMVTPYIKSFDDTKNGAFAKKSDILTFANTILKQAFRMDTDKVIIYMLEPLLLQNAFPQKWATCLGALESTSRTQYAWQGLLKLLVQLTNVSDAVSRAILECADWDLNEWVHKHIFGRIHRLENKDIDFANVRVHVPSLAISAAESRQEAFQLALNLIVPSTCPTNVFGSEKALTTLVTMLEQVRHLHRAALITLQIHNQPWDCEPNQEMLTEEDADLSPGLVNPGSICYMNALLQQLFMIPSFRRGILTLRLPEMNKDLCDVTTIQWVDEFTQLQRLFAAMAFTNSTAVDPTWFALSHTDLEGNLTNLDMQMDADEFFCMLLDRLKSLLEITRDSSGLEATTPLDTCFGGKLVHQITTEHGVISEREEPYFALSLEVTNQGKLEQSLALYVEEENLSGSNAYFCEKEQQKVNAIKRVRLQTLPKVLVFHLKRFTFDFDTMEKYKSNDALEFPFSIDMKPFTSQSGAEDDEKGGLHYRLRGIVIHVGTADAGHYYSYIDAGPKEGWYEWNDHLVRKIDISDIGKECFGGQDLMVEWDSHARRYISVPKARKHSAYVLLYEPAQMEISGNANKTLLHHEICEKNPSLASVLTSIHVANYLRKALATTVSSEYLAFLGELVVRTMAASNQNGILGARTILADTMTWENLYDRLLCTKSLGVSAAKVASEWLFGIAPSFSLSSFTNSSDWVMYLTDSIVKWVQGAAEEEAVLFSCWLLHELVFIRMKEVPTHKHDSTSEIGSSIARTWLLDILLVQSNMVLREAWEVISTICIKKLVAIPSHHLVQSALKEYVAYMVELFWCRGAINIVDPLQISSTIFAPSISLEVAFSNHPTCYEIDDSNSVSIVPMEALVVGILEIGKAIKNLIQGFPTVLETDVFNMEAFSNQFLLSLQSSFGGQARKRNLDDSDRIDFRLASRARSSTIHLELTIMRLLCDHDSVSRLCDPELLLSSDILYCAIQHNSLTPEISKLYSRTITTSISSLLSDTPLHYLKSIVATLIHVLECVKTTEYEAFLHILDTILDHIERVKENRLKVKQLEAWYKLLFSRNCGILGFAYNYREQEALTNLTFALLQFTLKRCQKSDVLRNLLVSDDLGPWDHNTQESTNNGESPKTASQHLWFVHWLRKYSERSKKTKRSVFVGRGIELASPCRKGNNTSVIDTLKAVLGVSESMLESDDEIAFTETSHVKMRLREAPQHEDEEVDQQSTDS